MENIIMKLTDISKEDSSMGILAEYLLTYEGDLGALTVTKLSEQLFISVATATRLATRLEIDGFSNLKLQLAEARTNPNISNFNDNMFNMYYDKMTMVLNQTLSNLNREQLIAIARELEASSKINFFAVGSSNIAVRYLGQKLTRINKIVTNHTDARMQQVEANHSNSTIVGVGVSYSGVTSEIIANLQLTKKNGGTTVLITSNQNVNYEFIDFLVKVPKLNEEDQNSISKRFTSVITLDLLYLCLIELNPQYYKQMLSQ